MMTVWHGDEFTIGRRHRASQVALVVKNPSANVGYIRGVDPIPWLRRSPGGEDGNPLKYSCLENSMNRGAWQAADYGVAKSWMCLSIHTQNKYVLVCTPKHVGK